MKKNSKKMFILSFIALINIIFIDFVKAESYNNYSKSLFSCGNGLIDKAPDIIPSIISIVYNIIQVAVPILLIVLGSIDLVKSISAQKEDEIKKGQNMFIKRLIAAVMVFLIFIIVKFVISVAADESSNDILECFECMIKNNDKCVR